MTFFSETDTLKNISYIFVSIKNQWGLLLYVQKHFFKISSFVFYKRKESHTGLERYEGDKMMTECSLLGELSL